MLYNRAANVRQLLQKVQVLMQEIEADPALHEHRKLLEFYRQHIQILTNYLDQLERHGTNWLETESAPHR
ncbi:hypothetical protein IQ266_09165 [filamentous cyanobacterium LEGE 11480]|uniref:Uncharacterized protein n=1 Tax=Romeriopsis navalis LEGE 11480 TaxID=2777977 RepID=A0A928VKA1_9CYAN|nr:hypothetical protein [Romeriopsis navalis]MBE9029895.1 hypothetical protein [Romeriopsis navalis LEGE 11480]